VDLRVASGDLIRTDVAWDMYLVDNVLALDKLWSQGKFEQFETYKSLAGITYEDYLAANSEHHNTDLFYCPYIPVEVVNVKFTVTK
jgi:hypothetical protein